MKRIIYTFALVAVAMILLPSCESAEGEMDGYVAHGDGVTLYVSDPTSRTSFTDEGTEGLSIVWEEGDTFALYDSDGARVDNFVCTTIENGAFSSVDDMTTLTEGAAYTAIYPASTEATLAAAKEAIIFAEQRGVEIDDMDDNCYMLMSFTYSAEVDIEDMVFEHQMAIMTIKFTTANITKIVFANGTDKYTINCEGIVAESGVYTSYAMIAPCEATSRELNFKLYTSGATEPVAIRTTTSTKAYVAGTRYTAELYNYSAPTLFSGGDGTEANPYQISTASDFNTLSTNVAADTTYEGEYFILTNDVDLGDENFTPVGQTAHYFKGIFDGGGNSVDIFISNTDTTYQALFGYINSATIKNIDVTGSISGYKSCAGIVGYAYNSSIINCRNYATIDSVSSRAGGIVGGLYISDNVESITISGCENYATITGDDCYVGGVIGYCNAASSSSTAPVVIISDCANYGSVVSSGTDVFWSSDPDKYIGLGGIVGYGTARIEISNCTNSGAVSMDGEYDATGGIIGYGSRVAITNCYNKSTVDGYRYVGGIAGYLTTTSSTLPLRHWPS